MSSVDRKTISAAHDLIRPYIRATPVVETSGDDFGLPGVSLVFKLESLQYAGSFKARGAITNLLMRDVPPAGVVAASGGNHGAAVAWAAQRRGVRATIFVPTVSAAAKVARIRSYGAELVITGDRYDDARIASEAFADESGGMRIHPFDQLETLRGAGTVALELHAQAPKLDSLLVGVGGGGLIGGIAAWYAGDVNLIGVEPFEAPTLTNALAAGHPVDAPAGGVAADSLAPKRVGALMFPFAQRFVREVLLVTDDEIRAAQNALWEKLRIAAEPGGAAAFAALLAHRYAPKEGERIGVLVCGANTEWRP